MKAVFNSRLQCFLKIMIRFFNNRKSQHFCRLSICKIYSKNYSLLSTFAQVSLKPTVLLKTNFSAEESLSTQK